MNRSWSSSFAAFCTIHGEGLSCPSLAIREHGHVVAIRRRLDKVPAVLKDLFLGSWSEDRVEAEGLILHLHSHLVDGLANANVAVPCLLLAQRTHPAEYADGALEVLHGIVQLLAALVDGNEICLRNASCQGFLQGCLKLLAHFPQRVDALHVHLLGLGQGFIHAFQKLLLLFLSAKQVRSLGKLACLQAGLLCRGDGCLQSGFADVLAGLLQLFSGQQFGLLHLHHLLCLLYQRRLDPGLLRLLDGELQTMHVPLLHGRAQGSLNLLLGLRSSDEVLCGSQLRGGKARALCLLQRGLQQIHVA
mmetsp:Transcript_72994/g.171114  ORF Transcript_72994/g.171114 Transcript_72994/m.171114 type:complete len:304 (-) Transcript_72994:2023-2934(-)